MILIEEANTRQNIFYKYLVDKESEKKTLLKTVEITCETSTIKNVEYSILYDSNMVPIKDAFRFINYNFLNCSPNTKYQAITALRILYSFLELFDLDLKELTDDDINNLKLFLKGYSPNGKIITINLNTDRSNITINTYLAMFRRYTAFLNIENCNLHKISPVTSKTFMCGTDIIFEKNSYVHNESVNKSKTVPMYVSVDEYKKVLDVIAKEYTIREECIVRLMYEGGFRIGEVLGLTIEDVQCRLYKNEDTKEVKKTAFVYTRNRVTDKDYQLAKNLDKPQNRRAYITKTYKDNTGKTPINMPLYNRIMEYIDIFHNPSSYNKKDEDKFEDTILEYDFFDEILNPDVKEEYKIKKKTDKSLELFNKNFKKYARADIVDKKANTDKNGFPILENNSYIFINNVGKPLNIISWNKIIREILEKSGLDVDENKRENNLNHRFRHGHAMFLVKELKYTLQEVADRLRQRNPLSAQRYFRPTENDRAAANDEFSKKLQHALREL